MSPVMVSCITLNCCLTLNCEAQLLFSFKTYRGREHGPVGKEPATCCTSMSIWFWIPRTHVRSCRNSLFLSAQLWWGRDWHLSEAHWSIKLSWIKELQAQWEALTKQANQQTKAKEMVEIYWKRCAVLTSGLHRKTDPCARMWNNSLLTPPSTCFITFNASILESPPVDTVASAD